MIKTKLISCCREGTFDTANPPYIRKYLRTYGLTPPRAESYETQKARCMTSTRLENNTMLTCAGLAQLALKQTPIEKYLYLSTIRKNNVHLFYRLVTDHIRVGSIR
jgi:malate dehydrogenase (oxaloacetate-decarboxylating)(NADP+)